MSCLSGAQNRPLSLSGRAPILPGLSRLPRGPAAPGPTRRQPSTSLIVALSCPARHRVVSPWTSYNKEQDPSGHQAELQPHHRKRRLACKTVCVSISRKAWE